jgi:hypothetical protein
MNKFKRKLFGLVMLAELAVACAAILFSAQYANADQSPQSFGCTNVLRSNTVITASSFLGSPILITEQDLAMIQIMGQGDAAGSGGTITVTLARSVDGTNYETHPLITCTTVVNGNTAVVEPTNLVNTVIGAARSIAIVKLQSGDTSANFTNFAVILGKKNTKRAP